MKPDLDGFREASVKLRAELGRDVPFFTPTPTIWPEGTPLDPQTGTPYDPVIQPVASGYASASVRAIVVLPGANLRADDVIAAAIGEIEEGKAAIVVGRESWDDNNLEDATLVGIYDETWAIVQSDLDGIGPDPADRVIIHAVQKEGGSP